MNHKYKVGDFVTILMNSLRDCIEFEKYVVVPYPYSNKDKTQVAIKLSNHDMATPPLVLHRDWVAPYSETLELIKRQHEAFKGFPHFTTRILRDD